MISSSGRGGNRSTARNDVPTTAKRSGQPVVKSLNERMTFFSLLLIGRVVTVKTTDSHNYRGIFHAMKETDQGEMHLILSHATLDDQSDTLPYAVIPHNVFESLSAEEVDLAGQDIAAKPFSAVAGFEDTANALENSGNERKLQAFVFDGSLAETGLEEAAASKSAAGGWSGVDMFAENERRFGVTATFEESLYTTALDNPNMTDEEAQRLANTILAERGGTAHEREERGQLDDSGMSEEDKYGAVLRHPGAPRAPLPPTPEGTEVTDDTAAQAASPQGAVGAAAGSNEREEINAVRRKLAEGKNLAEAVPPHVRTKYVNNAPAVDALNLMPGTGSTKFHKGKVSNVANQLDNFKAKRLSSSGNNLGGVTPTAAPQLPPGPGGEESADEPADAAAAPQEPGSVAPDDAAPTPRDKAPAAKSGTAMKLNPDATPFSFNPKSTPFMPSKKPAESPAAFDNSSSAPGYGARKGRGERGDGVRGGRGRQGRGNGDSYVHGQGLPRPQGYMYGGAHMGMVPQNMHSMMSQPMPGGPRGVAMPQVPHGFGPVMFPYPYPMSTPVAMQPGVGGAHQPQMIPVPSGFQMQPNMQPGFNPGQSPPSGYVPPTI